MKRNIIALGLAGFLLGSVVPSQAETISIYDDSFSVVLPGSLTGPGGILSGRWGTWNSETGVFTQEITNTLNAGYVDLTAVPKELSITLNQTLNLGQSSGAINGVYAPGTLLALAIFTNSGSAASDVSNSHYNASWARAILTDTSWLSVNFANNANMVDYVFTANTTAVVGSFSYNGGNETITLVPEPSTGALMMIGAAGLVALRRLRKV